MRRALVGLCAAALAALAIPALAGHTDQMDPSDTGGRLDVEAARFTHGSGPPTWRFVTFSNWTVREIWDLGYLIVELDTRGDEGIDHRVVVRSDGRDLEATLYRVRGDGTQRAMGTVQVTKNGPRAASVSVALRKLTIGPLRSSYFWSVVTTFSGSACPRTCVDRVPDAGMVEQLLPGVTPTPTPTPTASPSG